MNKFFVAVLLFLSFLSCTQTPTITNVAVNAASTTINASTSTQLSAVVTGTGAFNNAVTWSVTSGAGNLSANTGANITFNASSMAGTTVVRATSTQDPSKFGEVTIQVGVATPTITNVTVNAINTNINPLTSTQVSAIVTGTGAFSNAVTWSVTSGGGNLSAATGATITFNASSSVGTTVVRATSTQDPSKFGEVTIKIGAMNGASNVSIHAPTWANDAVDRPLSVQAQENKGVK